MRIGLFGGTFNPIHIGHLRAALEVKEGFGLDEVVLIPAALPPHKAAGDVAEAADRLHMLHLALEQDADIRISDVELKRAGPSYTIDTVEHFKRTLSDPSQIYLIMGMDAFLEFDSWKSFDELLRTVPFIIISRPQTGFSSDDSGRKSIGRFLNSKISDDYAFSESQKCFRSSEMQPVFIFHVTGLDISATRVRRLIGEGRSIRHLVPPAVLDYINAKGLYS
jgi:nicotinate-nucleotide adenylyltransferase